MQDEKIKDWLIKNGVIDYIVFLNMLVLIVLLILELK